MLKDNKFLIDLKADLIAHGAKQWTLIDVLKTLLFKPGFWVVFNYRMSHCFYGYRYLKPLGRFFWLLNVWIYGCYISPLARIGKGLSLPYPNLVVISDESVIGENVRLYHNVTIGRPERYTPVSPKIGDGVTIYTGSVVIGDITLGANCVIGAHSMVTKDVKDGETFMRAR